MIELLTVAAVGGGIYWFKRRRRPADDTQECPASVTSAARAEGSPVRLPLTDELGARYETDGPSFLPGVLARLGQQALSEVDRAFQPPVTTPKPGSFRHRRTPGRHSMGNDRSQPELNDELLQTVVLEGHFTLSS